MRVTIDGAGRIVLPKPIREAAGLSGGQQVEVRLAGVVIEIEPPGSRPRPEHSGDPGLPVDQGPVAVETERIEIG